MCKIHEYARDALNLLIWKKGRLTLEEILETLRKEAGTTEISDGMDVREWLNMMVEEGLVKIDGEGRYVF